MFELTVSKNFTAKHALLCYHGANEKSHSHEWRCEVTIFSDSLDEAGCALDFAEADSHLKDALRAIEGRLMNESEAFAGQSPSAENVARYLFEKMSKAINRDGKKVTRVRVWEDENHSAAFVGN